MNKKIIAFIIVIILAFVAYQAFFKKAEPEYNLSEVERGSLTRKVSETGIVKKGEKISLSFKNPGRIEKIYVSVGDKVKAGQSLAKQETTQSQIKLQEAEAALALAEAQLSKLLNGATAEEIKIAQTTVDNAKVSLQSTEQNLADVKSIAQENLEQDYEDGLNSLETAYLKIYNASNELNSLQRTYFYGNDQESLIVKEKNTTVKNTATAILVYVNTANNDPSTENTDKALIEMKAALNKTYSDLQIVRNVFEEITYRDVISATDKSAIDTQKTNINTSLASIVSSQQTIASTKLTNESNINTAQSQVVTAQGTLKSAQDNLALTLANPQQADIDLNEAKIQQAKSNVNLLKNQIEEAILFSPTDGQITAVNRKVGEMATDGLISLIPAVPLQVETNIPEVNIGKVKVGQPTEITLDALEETIFTGRVIKIEPTETILQGVVYYKIYSSFESDEEQVKPGMTANVDIIIDTRENVLIVPQRAVIEKDNKKFVRIPSGDGYTEREVQTGLRGSQSDIEIISGLEEGEKVITYINEK
ncbi:MAG: efflux RND transporter periplasmic adaptor subunit [bacterium]